MSIIDELEVTPNNIDNPVMLSAWLGLVHYLLDDEGAREQFKKETGHNIDSLAERNSLEKLIDQSTGYERLVFKKWMEWVTKTAW